MCAHPHTHTPSHPDPQKTPRLKFLSWMTSPILAVPLRSLAVSQSLCPRHLQYVMSEPQLLPQPLLSVSCLHTTPLSWSPHLKDRVPWLPKPHTLQGLPWTLRPRAAKETALVPAWRGFLLTPLFQYLLLLPTFQETLGIACQPQLCPNL